MLVEVTYYGYAVVGTVSGTSISFGSEATWRGANAYSAENSAFRLLNQSNNCSAKSF